MWTTPFFLRRVGWWVLTVLVCGCAVTSAAPGSRPNVIIVMPDDIGYGDFACHGNRIAKTPAVDRLWKQSVRFTQFQVSPTCAPTRAALLTGRHEFKSGVTHTIFERERLAPDAVTLAEMLRAGGYRTGLFGKWHLGDERAYWPDRRGFDEFYIHGGGGIGQTYAGSCGDAPDNSNLNPTLLHNGRFVRTQGYCTDLFFAQALRWIHDAPSAAQPFFALITPNAAHAPLIVPEEYYRHYLGRVPEMAAKFYGMVENVDTNLGRLLDRLDEWGLATNTLVLFLTDNGGTVGVRVHNAGLRGGKASPYQGGVRVPSLWRWPAAFSGGVDCPALAAHLDVVPTLVDVLQLPIDARARRQIEGRSLWPLLKNPAAAWPDRTLITHVGRWPVGGAADAKFEGCSVRNQRFSLVNNRELYDLKLDPGESRNVVEAFPDEVRELRRAYDRWWKEVQPALVNETARGPKVNPFKELYWQQFGGAPEANLLKLMDPAGKFRSTER